MAKQVQYIQAMVKSLGKYKNIAVWNTWQEIGYWSDGLIGERVCYCDNTISHFRRTEQELDDVKGKGDDSPIDSKTGFSA